MLNRSLLRPLLQRKVRPLYPRQVNKQPLRKRCDPSFQIYVVSLRLSLCVTDPRHIL
jgi:hypothetical protein